tara:strand:+ start:746 stop:931 length:186 start_codon:yes stop_codon:yes gene_type:complete
MTYSELAARNAETIADVGEHGPDADGSIILSEGEYQALKTAALVFQIEHGHSKMEIRDDIG